MDPSSSDKEAKKKRKQEKAARALAALLETQENTVCADCEAQGVKWASVTLGCFLCSRCASLHKKSLPGTLSTIKSLGDTFSSEEIKTLQDQGNERVNKKYLNPSSPLPPSDDPKALEIYISNKYERLLYVAKPPVSRAAALKAFTKENADAIKALQAMGFKDKGLAVHALRKAGGRLDQAVELLVSQTVTLETLKRETRQEEEEEALRAAAKESLPPPPAKKTVKFSEQLETFQEAPKKTKKKKTTKDPVASQDSVASSSGTPPLGASTSSLSSSSAPLPSQTEQERLLLLLQKALNQLHELGFTDDTENKAALKLTRGNVQQAANWIADHRSSSKAPPQADKEEREKRQSQKRDTDDSETARSRRELETALERSQKEKEFQAAQKLAFEQQQQQAQLLALQKQQQELLLKQQQQQKRYLEVQNTPDLMGSSTEVLTAAPQSQFVDFFAPTSQPQPFNPFSGVTAPVLQPQQAPPLPGVASLQPLRVQQQQPVVNPVPALTSKPMVPPQPQQPQLLAPIGQPLYKSQINPFSVTDLTQALPHPSVPLVDVLSKPSTGVKTEEGPKKGSALFELQSTFSAVSFTQPPPSQQQQQQGTASAVSANKNAAILSLYNSKPATTPPPPSSTFGTPLSNPPFALHGIHAQPSAGFQQQQSFVLPQQGLPSLPPLPSLKTLPGTMTPPQAQVYSLSGQSGPYGPPPLPVPQPASFNSPQVSVQSGRPITNHPLSAAHSHSDIFNPPLEEPKPSAQSLLFADLGPSFGKKN